VSRGQFGDPLETTHRVEPLGDEPAEFERVLRIGEAERREIVDAITGSIAERSKMAAKFHDGRRARRQRDDRRQRRRRHVEHAVQRGGGGEEQGRIGWNV
jgi:hypothetical protein